VRGYPQRGLGGGEKSFRTCQPFCAKKIKKYSTPKGRGGGFVFSVWGIKGRKESPKIPTQSPRGPPKGNTPPGKGISKKKKGPKKPPPRQKKGKMVPPRPHPKGGGSPPPNNQNKTPPPPRVPKGQGVPPWKKTRARKEEQTKQAPVGIGGGETDTPPAQLPGKSLITVI